MESISHASPAYNPEVLTYFRKKIKLTLEGIKLRVENNHHNEPKFMEDLKGWEKKTGIGDEELVKHLIVNRHDEEQKNDLEAAMERFDRGIFGFCQNPGCGQVIPFDRLDAIPQAKYCLLCQVKASKSIKIFAKR